MTKRINQYDLGVALILLNRAVSTSQAGVSTQRVFTIDYANGGVKLVCDGGSKEVSERMSKRELYNHMRTAINVLSEHKQTYICL